MSDSGAPYHVPSVLDDANFLREDLDEPVCLSLTEHHAADGGYQSLIGQVQRSVSRIHGCYWRGKDKIMQNASECIYRRTKRSIIFFN